MKKVRIEIEINVDDDFEIGDCKNCPYGTSKTAEPHYGCSETSHYCLLGFKNFSCPINI